MINIGITISSRQTKNIWSNGIGQNAINLYLLLKNITNINPIIVNALEESEFILNDETIKIHNLNDVINDMNIIFTLGTVITDDQYTILKQNNGKLVFYNCGANYFNDMQLVLFDKPSTEIYKHQPDEIWTVPQHYETNKYYFEALYNVKNISIPFIWSSVFIERDLSLLKIDGLYKPSDKPKRLSVFEPNIDIVKYSLYPVLIAEKAYKERKDLFEHLYVTNTETIKKHQYYIDTMNHFEIVKEHKASFEDRWSMPFFLSNYTDIVISHQMYSPLNYAYLDALYLNYPLVHNAYMIKEAGYYYDKFNVEQGKDKLLYAITEHDKHLDEYKEKSKVVLDRYLPTNEHSIKIYENLIKKLLK